MNRNHLTHAVREQLVRYPAPNDSHYGVIPLSPPEDALPIQAAQSAHDRALTMLGRIQTLAAQVSDPYVISRTLSRREAVDSSAIEGTNSTLNELLTVEENDDDSQCARSTHPLRRNRVFAAEAVLAIVNRPFGAAPEL